MEDINIVPIFNQSDPNIWDDFLHIRAASVMHVYNYKTPEEDDESTKKAFKSQWKHKSFNFAFGAYNGFRMVGFIRGYAEQNVSNIEQLYVLPDYMSKRIGRRLLSAAERVSTFCAKDMELVSLVNAQTFYEKNGYKSLHVNRYAKHIDGLCKCSVVPVFRSTPFITRSCKQICADFDATAINQFHSPMFVYMDVDSKIQAYIIRTQENQNSDVQIARSQSDFIKTRLLREFKTFSDIQTAIQEIQNKR